MRKALIYRMMLFVFAVIPVMPGFGSAPRVLICAEVHGRDYPTTRGLYYLADLVKRRTKGRVEIKVYHSAQLGSEKVTIEMAQQGFIDLIRVNGAPMGEFNYEIGLLGLPYLFRDDEHRWKVLDGKVGQKLLAGLERSGMIGLCYYDSGSRNFYNNKLPIYKPEDLKGLKIRLQDSQLFMDFVQLLGAYPTPMAFEEVYEALKIGLIDGAENNASSYLTTRHYELARYYSLSRHSSVPEVLVISKKTWESLPDGDREIIRKAARESQQIQKEYWAEMERNSLRAIIAGGCQVNEVDLKAFQRAVKPLYDKYGAGYEELITEIRAVR